MSWMKYNTETNSIDLLGYISELSTFRALVMEESTWKIITKKSPKTTGKTRRQKFLSDLFALLEKKDKKTMQQPYDYVLHIELSADESNALISVQRSTTYEYIFRNEIISLSGKA